MYAVLYLIVLTLAGRSLRRRFLWDHVIFSKLSFSAKLSSDFLLGVIPFTSLNYFLALFLNRFLPASIYPLLPSNILIISAALALIVYGCVWDQRHERLIAPRIRLRMPSMEDLRASKLWSWRTPFYLLSFLIFCIWAQQLTGFVLRSENGHLGAGFSVFSDYAPHTAVVSSFAKGRNFPTEYPHFAGDGIQYHFFFFFLAGNLQYLGLGLAAALNLPSALGLLAFCVLLGSLARRWSGRDVAFLLAPMFVFLRSSNAVWHWLASVPGLARESGVSVLRYIRENSIFIGRQPYDDWGLWNLNVYANQRHLLFVLAAALVILMIFLPTLKQASLRSWLPLRAAGSTSGWMPASWSTYVPALLLFVFLPFWHGSVTIAILLILAFMAIWGREKLAYVAVAVTAVVMSLLYTGLFSGDSGNVIQPGFQWGFIVPDKRFFAVLAYLWELLGLSLPAILILPLLQSKKWKRILGYAFVLPLIFALTVSLTPDVTVNHKYIMISQIFTTVLTADFVLRLWRSKPLKLRLGSGAVVSADTDDMFDDEDEETADASRVYSLPLGRIAAIILAIMLTLTGVIDLITYSNKNQNIFWITETSDFQTWLVEETDPSDIFLTAPWHYHPFFLSGRRVWYGHSYYAWSAGHDTGTREDEVRQLFLGSDNDPKLFIDYCMQNSIRYVILSDDLRASSVFELNESFFSDNFELVAHFLEMDNALIYQIY